jgi:hypothetical protein
MFLHLKDDLDASDGSFVYIDQAIDSAEHAIEALEALHRTGDVDLGEIEVGFLADGQRESMSSVRDRGDRRVGQCSDSPSASREWIRDGAQGSAPWDRSLSLHVIPSCVILQTHRQLSQHYQLTTGQEGAAGQAHGAKARVSRGSRPC